MKSTITCSVTLLASLDRNLEGMNHHVHAQFVVVEEHPWPLAADVKSRIKVETWQEDPVHECIVEGASKCLYEGIVPHQSQSSLEPRANKLCETELCLASMSPANRYMYDLKSKIFKRPSYKCQAIGESPNSLRFIRKTEENSSILKGT